MTPLTEILPGKIIKRKCGPKRKLELKKKYGRLTVLKELPSKRVVYKENTVNIIRWILCLCDCGKKIEVRFLSLNSGNTRSCGCLKDEVEPGNKTHGLARTKEFLVWMNMRRRCNPNKFTKNYTDRNIRVCKRWENSFENFLADMGKRPSDKHSIERKNNDKGYCKSNCKWALKVEQIRNRRVTFKVRYNGKLVPVISICEKTGIRYNVLRYRLRNGWTLKEALAFPTHTKLKSIKDATVIR